MLFFNILARIWRHRLTHGEKITAVGRFLRWQIGSRILPGAAVLPFVGATRLVMERGMTGATGNWYCGLWEADEMAFLLHFLRKGELFIDVGANVGSHTILVSGGVGASTIAIEPIPATFAKLETNIRVNGLNAIVDAHCCGLSDEVGEILFTSGMDTLNHVAVGDERAQVMEIPVTTLDSLCINRIPRVAKIDVEGHEPSVLKGGEKTLSHPDLRAVLLETNDLGARYGHSNTQIIELMQAHGFVPSHYDPLTRTLSAGSDGLNTIFVRDISEVQEICRSAPKFSLVNGSI